MAAAEIKELELSGPKRLFYSTKDAMDAEVRMGKSIGKAIVDGAIGDLVVLLWAGMRFENEKLTVEQVTRMLDTAKRNGKSLYDAWEDVADALIMSGILPSVRRNNDGVPADPPVEARSA